VTGIEPTMSGLLDQRRSRSDNQARIANSLILFLLKISISRLRFCVTSVKWTLSASVKKNWEFNFEAAYVNIYKFVS